VSSGAIEQRATLLLVPSNPKGTDGEATWSGSTSPGAVGVDDPFPTSAVVFSEVAEAKG